MAKKPAGAKSKSTKIKTAKKRKPKPKADVPEILVVCNIHIYGADGEVVNEVSKIAQSDVPNNMLALLSALRASTSGVS